MMDTISTTSPSDARVRPVTGMRLPAIVLIAVAVFIVDHLTKWAAETYLQNQPDIVLIPGCLSLSFSTNEGIAFGLFPNGGNWLRILTPVALCFLGYYLWLTFGRCTSRWTPFMMGLILGGAVGNIWDRWMRGFVVDFILAYYGSYHWPTFNIADSALCIGVGIAFLLLSKEAAAPTSSQNESPVTTSSQD